MHHIKVHPLSCADFIHWTRTSKEDRLLIQAPPNPPTHLHALASNNTQALSPQQQRLKLHTDFKTGHEVVFHLHHTVGVPAQFSLRFPGYKPLVPFTLIVEVKGHPNHKRHYRRPEEQVLHTLDTRMYIKSNSPSIASTLVSWIQTTHMLLTCSLVNSFQES